MLTHPETMTVQLRADSIGFGLSLGGGATEYGNYSLVIATIVDGGPAARSVMVIVRAMDGSCDFVMIVM